MTVSKQDNPKLAQDVDDLVERMKLTYKTDPADALKVMANALGQLIGKANLPQDCGHRDGMLCMGCLVQRCIDLHKVVVMSAMVEVTS